MKSSKKTSGKSRSSVQLTLFVAGSHASHSVTPDYGKDQMTTVISGLKCYELYGRFSPLGSLVKTLLESSAWGNKSVQLHWQAKNLPTGWRIQFSRTLSTTLNKSAIQSNRLLFQLVPSEPLTDGIESGLLPTISASGDGRKKKEDWEWTGRYFKAGNGQKVQSDVRHIIENLDTLLPTPRARMTGEISPNRSIDRHNNLESVLSRNLLPTPIARDFRSEKASDATHQKNSRPLSEALGRTTGWKLQPEFVEWMMGFPEGWTELEKYPPNPRTKRKGASTE